MKKLLGVVCALLLSTGAFAANPQVEIKTNLGTITVELYPEKAPKTVENFLQYVKSGFYKDSIFHRVIPGFMIQGGGFSKAMEQKATRDPVVIESNNGLKNDTGTIAMARTQNPNSATAQFFINVADNAFLNYTRADRARLRLYRVRQGGQGHGRGREDRAAAHRRGRPVPAGRAAATGGHRRRETVGGKVSKVRLQTSMGDIVIELDTEKAPVTAENFLQYVRDGFYDNTVFHRVINGFMVQGGGFEPGMKQKPMRAQIENEAAQRAEERCLYRRHGAHVGSALGHRAILLQCRRTTTS